MRRCDLTGMGVLPREPEKHPLRALLGYPKPLSDLSSLLETCMSIHRNIEATWDFRGA